MKKHHKFLCIASLLAMAFSVAGCDKKDPDKGYLSDEQVLEIVKNFDEKNVNNYGRVAFVGNIQYYGLPSDIVTPSVEKSKVFMFTKDKANNISAATSYYLGVPLKLTYESWTADIHEDPEVVTYNSTKYFLESKLITTSEDKGYGICKCYYYAREDGGLTIKTFAQNKKLQIKNPTRLNSNAKWNIEIQYNANGYLVSEKFETINKGIEDDSKTCYGEATYEFTK